MLFRRTGFTLVELMVVMSILGILIAAIAPKFTAYLARGRDVQRLSDIKSMSAKFQDYNRIYGTYPSNIDASALITSRCISDIRTWTSAVAQIRDKQFAQLGGTGSLRSDPKSTNPSIGICTRPGSYFYAQLTSTTSYGVLAARMERQTTGANYSGALNLTNPLYINEMVTARPLDKNGDAVDKLYIIITN